MKRIIDVIVAFLLLILLSPIILLGMVVVRIVMGTPVFFKQIRPGLNGKPFTIYKLRTMTDERDKNGRLSPAESRLTGLGLFLRATSIDELPQLWNVLIGDMSLVGPRPLLMEYLARYTSEQARRNEVRPGITGWAQVNGRNALSWEERFKLDVWYVDNQCLLLDMRILYLTALKIMKRERTTFTDGRVSSPFQGTAMSGDKNSCKDDLR